MMACAEALIDCICDDFFSVFSGVAAIDFCTVAFERINPLASFAWIDFALHHKIKCDI